MFEGIITALITPFKNGEVDYKSLKNLVHDQLRQGVDGFVVHGTTGESPTTTDAEKIKIFDFIKTEVANKVPLILGTGSNSTAITVQATQKAQAMGAHGVLVVVPYYNKPSQQGLFEHFKTVAQSTELPVILYNVPSRTITALELETIVNLSKIKNIVAIKEASGNLEFGEQILKQTKLTVLSGDDKTSMALAAKGGKGVIAVASHLIGKEMAQAYKKIKEGDSSAHKEYETYFNLIESLYVEANPIPLKYALKKKGIIESEELRLPLVALSESFRPKLDKALEILK